MGKFSKLMVYFFIYFWIWINGVCQTPYQCEEISEIMKT